MVPHNLKPHAYCFTSLPLRYFYYDTKKKFDSHCAMLVCVKDGRAKIVAADNVISVSAASSAFIPSTLEYVFMY